VSKNPTVCVDLNGVLDFYQGWQGSDHWDPPRPGAFEFLEELSARGFRVVIFSTKDPKGVDAWLRSHGLAEYVAEVTDRKVPAVAYVDDRAVRFRGDYKQALLEIDEPPYWKQGDSLAPGCVTPEALAQAFHEIYERLAPFFEYSTRKASSVPWDRVPKKNRDLMIATARDVLKWIEDRNDGKAVESEV
jgi:hypothetical protein